MTGEIRRTEHGTIRFRSEFVMQAILTATHIMNHQGIHVRKVAAFRKKDGRVRIAVTGDLEWAHLSGWTELVRSVRINIPKGRCPAGHWCASVNDLQIHPDADHFKGVVRSGPWSPSGWLHRKECPLLLAEEVLDS